ncbi:MAG: DUF1971 domain-containing protein [Sneathiella sp.]
MFSALPDGAKRYSTSPIFNQETVPQALLKDHQTKAGVWGRLVVLDGSLDFIIPDRHPLAHPVIAPDFAVIEPEIIHHVSLKGPVRFQVEFYRIEHGDKKEEEL